MPNSPSSSSKDKMVKPSAEEKKLESGTSGADNKTRDKKPLFGKERREVKKAARGARPKWRIPYPYFHLAFGLLGTGGLLFGLFFTSQKLAFWSPKLEQDRSQLAALEESSLGQLSLEQQYRSVESESEAIHQAFPNEATIMNFFKYFGRLSGEAKVESFDFDTDQPVLDPRGFNYIGFGFEVVGSAGAIESFLAHLNDLPYLIEYSLVDLNLNQLSETRLVVRGRLGVANHFYLGEDE